MFELNQNADVDGTCLQGYVLVIPSKLVELFGEPRENDGYKVSGEYVFESEYISPDGC